MAEILGFYELLHSAGGCVSRVMCSARLDLNSQDTEKGETNLQEKNKEEHKAIIIIIIDCINTVCRAFIGGLMHTQMQLFDISVGEL